MKAIVNGRFLMADSLVTERVALLYDTKIHGLAGQADMPADCEIIDAKGMYVSPGLVDIHIHGYVGEDTSDGSADGIRKIARAIIQNGVTSWCPTTMTIDMQKLRNVLSGMRTLREESKTQDFSGAEILGVHAEGPFINPVRKGAQNSAFILPPDASFIKTYQDIIKIVTIAPEMESAMDFIDEITRDTKVLVSAGHTDASYEVATEAIWHGLAHITHTFNAMTPLNHRAPGVVGAALTAPVTAELIADTFHVHSGLFQMIARAKGGDKLILITDCMRAGGLSDGTYDLGEQTVLVNGIECRLVDGTIAGSVLKLNNAVANMRAHTDLPLWEIVNMASRNPANAIGATSKGTLDAGKDADIILCNEAFCVKHTIVRGETVYAADA